MEGLPVCVVVDVCVDVVVDRITGALFWVVAFEEVLTGLEEDFG